MEPIRHPIAPEALPYFVTAPGDFDQMLYVVAAVWIVGVLLLGGFYFWLHSLPERVAHKRRRTQMELVAVLGLIGLFTHNNIFWIAALLLAMVELPVISGPLARIADALEALATMRTEPADESGVDQTREGQAHGHISEDGDGETSPAANAPAEKAGPTPQATGA